jgi:hypothetical protein
LVIFIITTKAISVFRKKTPAEAEELMAKISRNYDDLTMAEPTMAEPTPTPAPMPAPSPK